MTRGAGGARPHREGVAHALGDAAQRCAEWRCPATCTLTVIAVATGLSDIANYSKHSAIMRYLSASVTCLLPGPSPLSPLPNTPWALAFEDGAGGGSAGGPDGPAGGSPAALLGPLNDAALRRAAPAARAAAIAAVLTSRDAVALSMSSSHALHECKSHMYNVNGRSGLRSAYCVVTLAASAWSR